MLLSLIALSGAFLMGLVFFIVKTVYFENEEQQRIQIYDDNSMEIKDIQAASQSIIVNQLNKMQKVNNREEGLKLINKSSSSRRPSALTQASSDDLESNSFSSKGSRTMRNMDDPFQVKKLKINTQSKSDPIEDEKAKSALQNKSGAASTSSTSRMVRTNTNKFNVKYDRKEVK